MRRILWGTAVAVVVSLPAGAGAGEPREGLWNRGRDIVQACFHKHGDKRRGSCTSTCSPCGADDVRIGRLIDTLLHAERACDRKWAADRLDDYNWTQHPEIVAALTYAMQSDCDRNVRVVAADSLKDMRVSDPDSIAAMEFTRGADPSCRVRYKAKWGIIKGERSRPPCLTYVSGYATGNRAPAAESHEPEPAPRLQPTPAEEPAPAPRPILQPRDDSGAAPEPAPEARRGVRGMISNAMARVRSRS